MCVLTPLCVYHVQVRRKLPPIPVGEEPVLTAKVKAKRPKPPARKQDATPRQASPSIPARGDQAPSPSQRPHQQRQQPQPPQAQVGIETKNLKQR